MAEALVIAANSFVGRQVCRSLEAAGVPHQATSRGPSSNRLRLDLTRPDEIEALLQAVRPRCIFQCAGITADGPEADHFRLHVDATRDVLDAARRHTPAATIILFGSAAEYGEVEPHALPVHEGREPRPQSAYGRSKLEQARLAAAMAARHGLHIHVLRPFNILGPGMAPHYFARAFAARLQALIAEGVSGEVPVRNSQATRDWVDVRDVADAAVRLALQAHDSPGRAEIWNVATGRETSLLTVAGYLCRLAGPFQAVSGEESDSRTGIVRSCGDAGKLRERTGWEPRVSWQESVSSLWASLPAISFGRPPGAAC